MFNVEEEIKIDKIRQSRLTIDEKRNQVSALRASMIEENQNSSLTTIITICNTMVGSGIVIIPIVFASSGIITSIFIVILIGFISCQTANLQVINLDSHDTDLPQLITRQFYIQFWDNYNYWINIFNYFRHKWNSIFVFSSIMLIYVAGVIYFLLTCEMLYPCSLILLDKLHIANMANAPSNDELVFDKYSFQWVGIFLICLQFMLFQLRQLNQIIKISQYGIISVILFILYTMFRGIENISKGNVNSQNIKLFSSDLITLSGVFALSFFIHSILIPIVKKNKNPQNNTRDVALGYFVTGAIYTFVGIFGALAICGNQNSYENFMDVYKTDTINAIVQLLLFLQLSMVLPILLFCIRSQFFNFFYDLKAPPNYQFILFNVVFSASCLFPQMLNVSPKLIMSLNGAVCGFILIYIIPIYIHFKNDSTKKSKGSYDENDTYENLYIQNLQIDQLNLNHSQPLIKKNQKQNFYFELFYYGLFMLVGITCMVINLSVLF